MSTDSRIHAIAQAASSAAPRVTTGGAGAAALGWVLSNEVLGVIGVLIALAGYLLVAAGGWVFDKWYNWMERTGRF